MTSSTMRVAAGVCLLAASAACRTVGPDYKRPAVGTPDSFRGADPASASAAAIADTRWSAVFVDEPLQQLITTALKENYDVRIAATRVLQAQARLGITRADERPEVDGIGSVQGQRSSVGKSDGKAATSGVIQVGASVSWAPDFWGKYRRATESARAQLLATDWARRAVMTSLVSEVASRYFDLLALDLQMSVATRTLTSREESLRLTQVRERGGVTSLVDVRQAEQLVQGARATIVDLERLTEQEENALSEVVGRSPGPIARGRPLTDQPHAPEIPAGLPSALIARRPDVQAAEQVLVAANADIGVARSAYFPQIALTGSGGLASSALTALFSGPALAWSAAASAVQPIFNANRTKSQVALADARREEASLEYQQTIQRAFREVSDSLVEYRRTHELTDIQQQLLTAAQDARRLADLRYQGGASSYLEVLDSDTRLFAAELDLVRAQLGELTAFVEIYRALGGGWQE